MEIIVQKPRNAADWLLLKQLYRSAFPRAERKPFAAIRRMNREGKADIWCILADGHFAGMATTVNGAQALLLDYFAIVERRRGKGIGSQAMECLLSLYGQKPVFLEIEDPAAPGLNRQLKEKRKEFYLSCGFSELGVRAKVFGVRMELMGVRCSLDYAGYRKFYSENISGWAADHLEQYE